MLNDLNKEMFEDVIVFSFSEPGAMGPNDVKFFKRTGEHFRVDYMSEKTPYSMLKECFPTLEDFYWNGPMRMDDAATFTIAIGGKSEDKETHIAEGWRHIYLDYGNHLAVKEELYHEVREIIRERDNCHVTFHWDEMLQSVGFAERIDSIEDSFYKQQKEDELLAAK